MLAVIQTGGKQYLVIPGQRLKIEKLEIKDGEEVVFDKVLLVEKSNKGIHEKKFKNLKTREINLTIDNKNKLDKLKKTFLYIYYNFFCIDRVYLYNFKVFIYLN